MPRDLIKLISEFEGFNLLAIQPGDIIDSRGIHSMNWHSRRVQMIFKSEEDYKIAFPEKYKTYICKFISCWSRYSMDYDAHHTRREYYPIQGKYFNLFDDLKEIEKTGNILNVVTIMEPYYFKFIFTTTLLTTWEWKTE